MEERARPRIITDEEVNGRSQGRSWPALMYNLSTGGCALESSEADVGNGDEVEIAIPGMATTRGNVAWISGDCAGVRFLTPIHADIVMYLGFKGTVGLSEADFLADLPNFARQEGLATAEVLVAKT